MAVSMYAISVPVFLQFLTALSDVIAKAEAHATANKIDEAFLVNMRLYPDMYPFVLQVQQCCSHVQRICSRMAGRPPADLPKTELTFRDLRVLIGKTVDALRSFTPEQIDGTEDKIIDMNDRHLPAQILLLNRTLPHFFFHCTVAYAILRHCGVPLGKHDFLGTPLELLNDAQQLQQWSFSR